MALRLLEDNPIKKFVGKTVKDIGQSFADVPAQVQDLLTMPARMLGTPHPPMVSKLATETLPLLAEKATTPIKFTIPDLTAQNIKSVFTGKGITETADIELTPLDIGVMGLVGAGTVRNIANAVKFNKQLGEQLIRPVAESQFKFARRAAGIEPWSKGKEPIDVKPIIEPKLLTQRGSVLIPPEGEKAIKAVGEGAAEVGNIASNAGQELIKNPELIPIFTGKPQPTEGKVLSELPIDNQKLAYNKFIEQGNKDTFEGFVKQFGNSQFNEKGEPIEVSWMQPKLSTPTGEGQKPPVEPTTEGKVSVSTDVAKSLGIEVKEGSPAHKGSKGGYSATDNTITIPKKLPEGYNREEILSHEIGHAVHKKLSQSDLDKFNNLVVENREEVNSSIRHIRVYEEKGGQQGYLEHFADLYGKYVRGEKLPLGDKLKNYFDEVAPLPKLPPTGEGQKPPIEPPKTAVSGEPTPKEPTPGIKNLNIPEEAKQKIINISDEIKPELEKVKGATLSHDEVLEAAKSADLLTKVTSRERTLKLEADLLKTRQHLSAMAQGKGMSKEFVDTLRTISAEATNLGRQLESLKIGAEPEYATVKIKLIKELTKIGIDTDTIVNAAQNIDFTNQSQVTDFYRKFVKPTKLEILNELRYINLLSSPKTHIVNTFSNLLQTIGLAPATKIFSGEIKQIPSYYKGVFKSIPEALTKANDALKGNIFIERPDIKRIATGSKLLKPFQIIPRALEASDVLFRTLAKGGELSSGQKEMESLKRAAYYVFRQPLDPSNTSGQGKLLSFIDKFTTSIYGLRKVPGVSWFIPFVQTPMNIFKQGIEYSPAGFGTLPGAENKKEQVSKALIGSLIFLGAGYLALQDKSTWSVPKGKKDKEMFYAAGLQPYSLKVGNKWISYSRLGPLAFPIAMAAAIKYYSKENPKAVTDSVSKRIANSVGAIGGFFADQSYLQGVNDLVNLAQGDKQGLAKVVTNFPSQIIPLSSFLRWVTNIVDPIYRKTDKEFSLTGVIENLQKGLPILSQGLESYRTFNSQSSKRQFPILNAFLPTTISKENEFRGQQYKIEQQKERFKAIRDYNKEQIKEKRLRLLGI